MWEDYATTVHCFKSYESIRNAVYDHVFSSYTTPATGVTIAKTPSVSPTFTDYHNDPNVLIVIQNDQRIMKLLMNCRKQKKLQIYIFGEAHAYMSIVIKNPNGCPIVVFRIPFSQTVYFSSNWKNNNMAFEFPLQKILDNMSKNTNTRPTGSYEMVFSSTQNGEYMFTYRQYMQDGIPNETEVHNLSHIAMQIVHNLFIQSDYTDKDNCRRSMQNQLNANGMYYFRFLSSNLMLLKEIPPANIGLFAKQAPPKSENYLIVDGSSIVLETSVGKTNTKIPICVSTDALIWMVDTSRRYKMVHYDLLFKKTSTKLSSDRVYYALAPFIDNEYSFIKITTIDKITPNSSTKTLSDIFASGFVVIECYTCILIQDENSPDSE